MWHESVSRSTQTELIYGLKSQLRAIGEIRSRRQMDYKEIIVAVGNIWLLEKIGEIQPDEFNGMCYICEGGTYHGPALTGSLAEYFRDSTSS